MNIALEDILFQQGVTTPYFANHTVDLLRLKFLDGTVMSIEPQDHVI